MTSEQKTVPDPEEIDAGVPGPDEIDWGPPTRPLEEGEPCPDCGYPFDSDEWAIRKLPSGPHIGETWKGECPECEQETYEVGT